MIVAKSIYVRIFGALLFTFLFSCLTPVKAMVRCELIHGASFYSYQNPTRNFEPGHPSQYLGMGVTGIAHLVREKGQIQVEKFYAQSERAKSDLYLLQEFRKIADSESGHFSFVPSRFAKNQARPEQPNMTVAPFVPGKSVHDLLISLEVYPDLKQRILEIYESKLKRLEEAVDALLEKDSFALRREAKEARYFRDRTLDSASLLSGKIRGIKFLIKTDNVIVDPSNPELMTVIDPY